MTQEADPQGEELNPPRGKNGGRRPGAGRKRGKPDDRTRARLARMERERLRGAEMPLDYMLRVMRHPKTGEQRRDDMAKAAARFCHPTLNSIDHGVKNEQLDAITKLFAMVRERSVGVKGLLTGPNKRQGITIDNDTQRPVEPAAPAAPQQAEPRSPAETPIMVVRRRRKV